MNPTFTLPSLCRNQNGTVIVAAAMIMSVLLGVMVFSMDAGFLYYKKNAMQNSVDAVALAGAQHLCEEDWEQVTRTLATENGLPGQSPQLDVITGFYDARDEFADDIGNDYKDFGPPPGGRYINAVFVRFTQTVSSLTGMNKNVTLISEAVAYLRRIDIASLDPTGSIQLGHDSIWDNTTFFSNGRIEFPEGATANGKNYSVPEFNDSELHAVDTINECGINVVGFLDWTSGVFKEEMEIMWGTGSPQQDSSMFSGVEPITEIHPLDEEVLAYWRARADIIYTADQAGTDKIYYGQGTGGYQGQFGSGQKEGYYFVDPAGLGNRDTQVLFFDAKESSERALLVGPDPGTAAIPHTPNGNSVTSIVLVATCSIYVMNSEPGNFQYTIGGENEKQVTIITPKDITFFTSNLSYNGVIFRAGGNIVKNTSSLPFEGEQRVRAIADGNITGIDLDMKFLDIYKKGEHGLYGIHNNARFGPPCPPALSRLGRLKKVSKN